MPTTTATVSASGVVLNFPDPVGQMTFSELVAIDSHETKWYSGDVRTKVSSAAGDSPTISLKRAFDAKAYKALLAWHGQARAGNPDARKDGTLVLGSDGKAPITFVIRNGWCQDLTVLGTAAGAGTVFMVQVTISCDAVDVG